MTALPLLCLAASRGGSAATARAETLYTGCSVERVSVDGLAAVVALNDGRLLLCLAGAVVDRDATAGRTGAIALSAVLASVGEKDSSCSLLLRGGTGAGAGDGLDTGTCAGVNDAS